MYIVSVQVQARSRERQGDGTNKDTVNFKGIYRVTKHLYYSSVPRRGAKERLTVAKAPKIANRHRPPRMDANHVYCTSE